MTVAGKPLPNVADFGRFSGFPAIGLAGVLLLILIGALGEETGWRGYALPQLQRRFSPLTSSLIIAVVWFGWHLPQFFVIATYRDSAPAQYAGMFLGLACGSVVLTWLYNRSGGSILLVAIWHGLYNFVSGTQAATGILAAVVSTLIMIQGLALIGLEVRARRHGLPSVLGPPEPPPPRGTGLRSRSDGGPHYCGTIGYSSIRNQSPSPVVISLRQVMTPGSEASRVKRRRIPASSMDSKIRRSPSICPRYTAAWP